MSMKILDKVGLEHLWTKLKMYFAPKVHTHNAFETKHSYTVVANAAKNWYRIANANTSQLDTTKPIRAQFIVTAYNTSYAADYYETWFVNAIVFGRQAHIVIFGGSGVPFSQARILYENTVANIDANDKPAIDLYLNYVLPNGTTKIEVEEIYNNGGWTFVADGQLAASSVPSGFESIASAPRNTGVNNSTYADYVNYLNRQISNISAAFTLADSWLYRSRTLNCTGTFTITVPSINSGYMWCVIKNKNATSGVITLHPSTTSVLIDGSNADIKLQPMEYVCIHSAGANNYSLIADGRWKSQKADKATTLAGYGITDAKIANGTITLGSSSITPLTDDSNYVHKTGDELITGVKVFHTNEPDFIGRNKVSKLVIKNDNILKGTSPEHTIWSQLLFTDNSNNSYEATGSVITNRLGMLQYHVSPDISGIQIAVYKQSTEVSEQSDKASLLVGYDENGIEYAQSPSTSSSRNDGQDILTRDWIPNDARIVHTTGNESIDGLKYFGNEYTASPDTYPANKSSALYVNDVSLVKGVVPSTIARRFINLLFLDSTKRDIEHKGCLGGLSWRAPADGPTRADTDISMVCWKFVPEGDPDIRDNVSVTVGYDADGIKHATAPSTSSERSNGTDIITRDWIPSDTRIVHTTGDETISGNKTLTNNLTISKGTPLFQIKGSGASNSYRDIRFLDKDNAIVAVIRSSVGESLTIGTRALDTWLDGSQLALDHTGTFTLKGSNGTTAKSLVGSYDGTLIWNGQAIQTSSDERLKTPLSAVPDEVLDAWEDVNWGQFQFLEAVQKKGGYARLHLGLIAQKVKAVFEAHGLDACAYGILCHEEREATEDSEVIDLWMIRYAEAQAMEAVCQRRKAERAEARIKALENRLKVLEASQD